MTSWKAASEETSLRGVQRRFRAQCPAPYEFPWPINSDAVLDLREFDMARKSLAARPDDERLRAQFDEARILVSQQCFQRMRELGRLPSEYEALLLGDEELLLCVADVAAQHGTELPAEIAHRAAANEQRVLRQLASLAATGFGESEVLAIHCSLEEARSGRPVSTFAMAPFIRGHVRRLAREQGLTVRFSEPDDDLVDDDPAPG